MVSSMRSESQARERGTPAYRSMTTGCGGAAFTIVNADDRSPLESLIKTHLLASALAVAGCARATVLQRRYRSGAWVAM
jgi:hypothetical protein